MVVWWYCFQYVVDQWYWVVEYEYYYYQYNQVYEYVVYEGGDDVGQFFGCVGCE